MAQAKSISLNQFASAAQAAVKSAVVKYPKFKVEPPRGVTIYYYIWGIPVPDPVIAAVTAAEAQAFSNEIAAQLPVEQLAASGGARAAGNRGVIYSSGSHFIVGIPATETEPLLLEK